MGHAVIVSPDVANTAGGVERMSTLLAGVLEHQGWTTSIVGPQHEVARWQFRLGLGPIVASRSAARAARAQRPDLLVTNGYLGAGYDRRTPRVHVYHGTSVGVMLAAGAGLPRRERIRRILGAGGAEAISARGASAIVCVSSSAAREARRFYRVGGTRVIANGIDTSTFSPRPRVEARASLGLAPDGRYALFVGRTEPGKGAGLLLEATRRTGFELLVAGRGGNPQARNLGVLTPATLALAYSAADCVLFPSLYEACSFVVLEALACGVPLLTTRVGWVPTLLRAVPEYEALCVEPTLADIVDRLGALADIDTAPLSAAARAFVQEHNSLASFAESWRAMLAEMWPQGLGTAQAGALRARGKSRVG
jgi:glycosyltransferase involved in cell wall biosynthesis